MPKVVQFNAYASKLKSLSTKAAAAGAACYGSLALAVDDATVTAAQTAGEASVLNASNGLITIIAVVVGISLVIALMKRA